MFGTLVAGFLALFALDAFGSNRSFVETLPEFLAHLAPAGLVLAVVGLTWHRPWLGAAAFAALASAYALVARRLDWILAISGPLLIVAASFGWSGWYGREDPESRRRL